MWFAGVLGRLFRRSLPCRRRPSPGSGRRPRRLTVEVLEDRLCLTGNLLVESYNTNNILAYDGRTGAAQGVFASGGGLAAPTGITLGPDNNVYVSSRDSNDVLRFDGQTGALLGTFVAPGDGGLSGPHGLEFDTHGNLVVNSGFNEKVLRYNGTTGTFQTVIAAPGSSPLIFPHGLAVGPDGNLYVGDRNSASVLRYDGSTGQFLGTFVSAHSGGLDITTDLVFGPDGNLYVNGFASNAVLRYDGHTGAFLGAFVPAGSGGLNGPQGLVFGPDGALYVSSMNTNQVLRYDGTTGHFLGVFASGGGLNGPTYLVFQHTTTTTAVSSPTNQPVHPGDTVSVTATVTPARPDAVTPTGMILFAVDGVVQADLPLNNGQATFSTSTLDVGTHTISATYAGDGNFNTSISGNFVQEVDRFDTRTVVASSVNPSWVGQAVTLTAMVSSPTPGAGTPTGSVTFSVDGVVQPIVSLDGGIASLTTSTLVVGSHSITAAYGGANNFNPSTSASFSQMVNKFDLTTALASSADPTLVEQEVTFTATLTAVQAGAPLPTGTVTFTVDGVGQPDVPLSNGQAALSTATLTAGSHTVTAAYNGDSNFDPGTLVSVTQTVDKYDTSTALASSANPALVGQAATFTATVTAVQAGAPPLSGTVMFTLDGALQPAVSLVNGSASLTTSTLAAGNHTLSAAYGGDGNFTSSVSASFSQEVDRRDTATTLTSSANPALVGQALTFTATVTAVQAGAATPSGTVTFTLDGAAQSAVSLSNGQAIFSTATLAPGSHLVSVAYSGDATFNLSTSAGLTQTVTRFGTTTALTSSANPALVGQAVTFTATVSAVQAGAPPLSGTVTFTLDGALQPAVSLVNGSASLTTSTLAAGNHTLSAAYGGDGNFTSSVSASFSQEVDRRDSTTTLTSSANPALVGQTLSFTATVTAVQAGAALPSGTVIFTLDGAAQSAVSLSNGQAIFSTATLTPGSHLVSVAYSGDATFNPSTSASLTQTVTRFGTSIALTSSANPALVGQTVTFTATVSSLAAGAVTPTGMVTFTVDGVAQPAVLLSHGQATFTTVARGPGRHSVTATYAGDSNCESSALARFTQVVNKRDTATALASSATSAFTSQRVSFTATVQSDQAGAVMPTGTVTFFIDGAAQSAVLLSNGQATFNTTTLASGSHAVSAAYNGDDTFNTSTSADLSEMVNKFATTTAVTSSADPSVAGQAVTFTATVSSSAPGAGIPTGTVTFIIDGVAQSAVALVGGTATWTTSTLAPGSHSVRVIYQGGTNFLGSTSSTLTQSVNPLTPQSHHHHHPHHDHDEDHDEDRDD